VRTHPPSTPPPRGRAIGIDLGTSNSVVAVIDADGAPRILTTPEGSTMLPSLVWFSSDGPIVGEAAREGLDYSPDSTIFGAKRLLGRRFDHPEIKRLARILPYELTEAPNGDTWIQLSPGRAISPEEVCALILRELRRMAEVHFGEPVTRTVLTIPAWYDAAQRQATKDAAQIAGLAVARLLSEPTAAALGHGAHRGDDRKYLVCDLGGGTFDVAAVDVEGGIFEVLATTGDAFLGGDDVDRAVVEHLVRDVRQVRNMDISTDAIAIERLRLAAQRAKHELSAVSASKIHVAELAQLPSGKGVEYAKTIRRDELELWAAPLIKRLEPPIRDALKRASRKREDMQEVLLVGGMTRMPAVRREVARVVGREPSMIDNPEEVVAVGAALEVARLEGTIEGVLLIDVAARGLCVSFAGGDCEPVIAQSAVVPTREHRVFATRTDEQVRIEFDIWEGESPEPSQNRHLGRYAVVDLPEAPAGDVLVLVEITLDTDGTVRLGASELVSSERLQLEQIFHAGLPRAEVARLQRQLAEAS
jgi:molecular chaperone DnaK